MMKVYEIQDDKLHDVTSFEIEADYTLCVVFDDNTEQIINFEPILLGPVVRQFGFEPVEAGLRQLTLADLIHGKETLAQQRTLEAGPG